MVFNRLVSFRCFDENRAKEVILAKRNWSIFHIEQMVTLLFLSFCYYQYDKSMYNSFGLVLFFFFFRIIVFLYYRLILCLYTQLIDRFSSLDVTLSVQSSKLLSNSKRHHYQSFLTDDECRQEKGKGNIK